MFGVTPLVCHQLKPAAEGRGSALKTEGVGDIASCLFFFILLEMDCLDHNGAIRQAVVEFLFACISCSVDGY